MQEATSTSQQLNLLTYFYQRQRRVFLGTNTTAADFQASL